MIGAATFEQAHLDLRLGFEFLQQFSGNVLFSGQKNFEISGHQNGIFTLK